MVYGNNIQVYRLDSKCPVDLLLRIKAEASGTVQDVFHGKYNLCLVHFVVNGTCQDSAGFLRELLNHI